MCYKELSGRQKTRTHGAARGSSADVTRSSPRSIVKHDQSFAKFEEKRRQQTDRIAGTVKSLFSKSSKKDKSDPVKTVSSKRGSLN